MVKNGYLLILMPKLYQNHHNTHLPTLQRRAGNCAMRSFAMMILIGSKLSSPRSHSKKQFYSKHTSRGSVRITSVQLLPVAACISEPHLLSQNGQNYWGYNPIVFMAPDPRFAIKDAVSELKKTVRELHRNNIEVILDVVYNHTAEGNDQGPNFNLKLLDTQYYQHDKGVFKNYTGCGNTLNLTHQASLNLVLDSLRHWVTEYKIDGFRFNLA